MTSARKISSLSPSSSPYTELYSRNRSISNRSSTNRVSRYASIMRRVSANILPRLYKPVSVSCCIRNSIRPGSTRFLCIHRSLLPAAPPGIVLFLHHSHLCSGKLCRQAFTDHAEHLHTASEAGTPPAVSDNALYAGVLSGIYRDSKYIFPGIQAVSNWAKLHFTRNRFGVRNDFRSLFYRIHLCQVTEFSAIRRHSFSVQNVFHQKQHVIKPVKAERFFLV